MMYQTQSRVTLIGPATVVGTITSSIIGTVITTVAGTVPVTVSGTVPVTANFIGSVGGIISPVEVKTAKRATITTQLISTVTTTMSTLLPSNPNRLSLYIRPLDPGTIFIGFMSTVSPTLFSAILLDYEILTDDIYTGPVTAVTLGGSVRIVVTEM